MYFCALELLFLTIILTLVFLVCHCYSMENVALFILYFVSILILSPCALFFNSFAQISCEIHVSSKFHLEFYDGRFHQTVLHYLWQVEHSIVNSRLCIWIKILNENFFIGEFLFCFVQVVSSSAHKGQKKLQKNLIYNSDFSAPLPYIVLAVEVDFFT